MQNNLIGFWAPADEQTRMIYGDVIIEFQDDQLIYTILSNERFQKIFLSYEISGDQIITDQASASEKQVTEFKLLGDKLELYFEGTRGVFYRDS